MEKVWYWYARYAYDSDVIHKTLCRCMLTLRNLSHSIRLFKYSDKEGTVVTLVIPDSNYHLHLLLVVCKSFVMMMRTYCYGY